ncbi:Cell cycle regulator Mat89Bb like protein [Chelonia mydas]|uniref:Cell cycle regulator Mat89Bb like protein n=1 Tax=Chelonia mydas TaxID=8469 RepID=M7BXE9_CHEMY|nr:Cell cycle regulator Mat89Bb like protein [Chelonia mydas]
MKIFSESHKTVFVVDHCPYMAESCRQHVEFDMLVKNRTQGIIPLAPISKSLWTCSVESSMEYCRIMYDIFPFKKLLMAALAAVGPPNPRADPECCSILHGLVAAVETLCKITEYQHEARTMLMENAERVGNRGRIICITNAKSDSHVRMLEDCVQETIHEHNKLAANSDHLMQIQKCELVLIHTYPVGEDSLVSDRLKKELSPVLTSEVHSVRAGRHLATKLNVLVQQHFDLASTTITNIPMKEEQHANTSANYDVELLHHKDAHVDFLKSGRSVLLEQPRKSGSKVISHMLSSHGGEIFLHVLSSSRSILEDPPSISEGCGGRVTDYRITDFGEFMRENRLTPFLDPRYKIDGSLEIPLERAKDQLEKHTRYWPMIISQTTIFNMQAVVPLASVIVKEALSDEDVLNCQKTIYNLVDMERKNDPLPISTVGTRGKGPKRSKPPEEEERKKRGRKREEKEDKSEKSGKDYELEKPWQESERLKGVLDREKEELAEAEVIKDSPDSPEPPNKKPLITIDEIPPVEKTKGPMSLLSLWSNRINTANSRKHQEFIGRLNSVNNKAELYQHLKEENGMETTENGKASRQ